MGGLSIATCGEADPEIRSDRATAPGDSSLSNLLGESGARPAVPAVPGAREPIFGLGGVLARARDCFWTPPQNNIIKRYRNIRVYV